MFDKCLCKTAILELWIGHDNKLNKRAIRLLEKNGFIVITIFVGNSTVQLHGFWGHGKTGLNSIKEFIKEHKNH